MADKEYIERYELIELFNSQGSVATFGINGSCAIVARIMSQPAADVAEVRYGEWVYDPDGCDWGIGAWRCSLCSAKNDNLGISRDTNPYLFVGSKYCPHCGATMRKGGSNDEVR